MSNNQNPAQAKPVMIQIPPMMQIGDVAFNPLHMICIDRRNYEQGKTGRLILIFMQLKEKPIELIDADADQFNAWYLSLYSPMAPQNAGQ